MSERLSFFATVLVAALGWLLTYYVDRVTNAPTIEYRISTQVVDSGSKSTFRLTNISRTKAFDPIEVHFLPRGNARLTGMEVVPVEPASEGPNNEEYGPGKARFVIQRLMPGSSIDFLVGATGPLPPKMHVDSTSALRLTLPSLETWLVRNEMCIVFWLIAFWLLALASIFSLTKKPKTDDPQKVSLEIANLGDLECLQRT